MISRKELEKRPMSTWTREETDYYNHITGQCECPYARSHNTELANALYSLSKHLGGSYANGEHFDCECVLEAIRRLNEPKEDECCQKKYGRHCGGECTCSICAPDLHDRDASFLTTRES